MYYLRYLSLFAYSGVQHIFVVILFCLYSSCVLNVILFSGFCIFLLPLRYSLTFICCFFQTMTIAGFLKLARLLRLLRVLRRIEQFAEYGAAVLMLLMVSFTLIAHWLACIFYAIAYVERPYIIAKTSWLDKLAEQCNTPYMANDTTSGPTIRSKYITALYFTFTTLTSIGFGNIAPHTNAEKIFAIFAMLLGCKYSLY